MYLHLKNICLTTTIYADFTAQEVKVPLAMLASHIRMLGQVSATLFPIHLPANVLQKAMECGPALSYACSVGSRDMVPGS